MFKKLKFGIILAGLMLAVSTAQARITSILPLPDGADQDVQFNDGGLFGADTGAFVYDKDTNTLTISTVSAATGSFSDGAIDGLPITFSSDPDSGIFHPAAADSLSFVTAGATATTINSIGAVNKPLQPSFLATVASSANVTGNATVWNVSYNTEVTDRNSDYNNATYIFTAPVDGDYFLSASVSLDGWNASHTFARLKLVTSNRNYVDALDEIGVFTEITGQHLSVTVVADMDANDTAFVNLDVSGDTLTVDLVASDENNYFSGSLIN